MLMLVAARIRTSTLTTAAAAQARELLVLQNVQQLGLENGRHFADLVEQDGPLVAEFKLPRLGMSRTGESASLVAEEFAFEQIGWNRSAVHLEKSTMSAGRELMHQAPKNFLASSALT